ncbi:MAG: hypothetical protein M1820_007442 [Bogoriella megaspora]|nr:MAG: hypothetical protein M1820_007442 [Bogoriella megaspora]
MSGLDSSQPDWCFSEAGKLNYNEDDTRTTIALRHEFFVLNSRLTNATQRYRSLHPDIQRQLRKITYDHNLPRSDWLLIGSPSWDAAVRHQWGPELVDAQIWINRMDDLQRMGAPKEWWNFCKDSAAKVVANVSYRLWWEVEEIVRELCFRQDEMEKAMKANGQTLEVPSANPALPSPGLSISPGTNLDHIKQDLGIWNYPADPFELPPSSAEGSSTCENTSINHGPFLGFSSTYDSVTASVADQYKCLDRMSEPQASAGAPQFGDRLTTSNLISESEASAGAPQFEGHFTASNPHDSTLEFFPRYSVARGQHPVIDSFSHAPSLGTQTSSIPPPQKPLPRHRPSVYSTVHPNVALPSPATRLLFDAFTGPYSTSEASSGSPVGRLYMDGFSNNSGSTTAYSNSSSDTTSQSTSVRSFTPMSGVTHGSQPFAAQPSNGLHIAFDLPSNPPMEGNSPTAFPTLTGSLDSSASPGLIAQYRQLASPLNPGVALPTSNSTEFFAHQLNRSPELSNPRKRRQCIAEDDINELQAQYRPIKRVRKFLPMIYVAPLGTFRDKEGHLMLAFHASEARHDGGSLPSLELETPTSHCSRGLVSPWKLDVSSSPSPSPPPSPRWPTFPRPSPMDIDTPLSSIRDSPMDVCGSSTGTPSRRNPPTAHWNSRRIPSFISDFLSRPSSRRISSHSAVENTPRRPRASTKIRSFRDTLLARGGTDSRAGRKEQSRRSVLRIRVSKALRKIGDRLSLNRRGRDDEVAVNDNTGVRDSCVEQDLRVDIEVSGDGSINVDFGGQ